MKKILGLISAVLLTSSVSFAVDSAKDTNNQNDIKQVDPSQMVMPKTPEIDPKVWDFIPETVAVVGNTKIQKQELVRALTPQVKMILSMGQKLNSEQYNLLAFNMTNEIVKNTILQKLASEAGYKVTPDMEDEVYNKFQKRFQEQLPKGQTIDFAEVIKKQGLNIADVKKQLADGEVIQNWVKDKIAPSITITDADAEKFYTDNKDKYFKSPETVTASHILIKPKEDTPKGWEEAKVEADKVFKEAQDGKSDFADLATKYSQGPSAKNGGKLGKFSKGQMVPEFEEACWTLAKNKINGIDLVKTKFGWHIIKVTAYDAGGYVKLNKELISQIKEQLKQQKTGLEVQKLIETESKKLHPVVNIKPVKAKVPVAK